jgi:hypothetical protein
MEEIVLATLGDYFVATQHRLETFNICVNLQNKLIKG